MPALGLYSDTYTMNKLPSEISASRSMVRSANSHDLFLV
jgi:hypothetical protein